MSDKTRDKLLPCPFCGGEAELISIDKHGWVQCKNCNAETFVGSSVERAIERWNTRKSMERIVERLETEILEQLSDCGDDWFTAEQINKAIDIVKEEGAV